MRSGKEVHGGEDGAMRDDEGSVEVEGGREGGRESPNTRGGRQKERALYCVYAMLCHAMPCHAKLYYPMTDGRRNETLIFVVLFIYGYTYRVLPTQV